MEPAGEDAKGGGWLVATGNRMKRYWSLYERLNPETRQGGRNRQQDEEVLEQSTSVGMMPRLACRNRQQDEEVLEPADGLRGGGGGSVATGNRMKRYWSLPTEKLQGGRNASQQATG